MGAIDWFGARLGWVFDNLGAIYLILLAVAALAGLLAGLIVAAQALTS